MQKKLCFMQRVVFGGFFLIALKRKAKFYKEEEHNEKAIL